MALADTLRRLSPSLYRLRLFVFICAGIVMAVSTYYLIYVRNQTGYFNNRNLRKLSLISSQIGSRLMDAGSVMEKTCERFIRPSDDDPYKFRKEADEKNNLVALQRAFKRLKDDSPQILPINIGTEKWSPNVAPESVTLTDIRYERDSSWLYFDYVADGIDSGTVIRIQAKTELSGLIHPFLTARIGSQPNQFQNILIAEAETARVILQYDPSQIRLASVDNLTSASDGTKIDLRQMAQASNIAEIALAGANYRLFSHPLKVSLPDTSASAPTTTWIITGVIKSDYFQSEAWSLSISYTKLVTFGFIVAILVFSWPFLKLVLTGPKDRFKTHDVYLLVFATMIVLAVITAFGLYLYVYHSVEAEMNNQVAKLAEDVKTNFKAELAPALQQLDTFSKNGELLNRLIEEDKQRERNGVRQAGWLGRAFSQNRRWNTKVEPACAPKDKNIYHLNDKNKTQILPCILDDHATTYPYFGGVAWIDKTGRQRAKWTVKDYTTQHIPVSDRAYFQNIQNKHFYEFEDHQFWLEPVISKTTGRNQVQISQRIQYVEVKDSDSKSRKGKAAKSHHVRSGELKDSDWIIAFDTRLLSLMDPVLPDGFGFIIINNDGKVLFHSDEVHHLGENLLHECDDDRKLRSAIIGRTNTGLDVRYSGQDHRFFITTLKGFNDWSIVAFRSKQPLRSAFLELMISLTALFLIHMFILMIAFTGFFTIYNRNKRRAWLWPEKEKIDSYKQLSYVMIVLSSISVMLALFLHGSALVWVSAGLAWFGALVYFLSLRFSSAKKKSTQPQLITETTDQTANSPQAASEPRTFEPGERLLKRYDGIYALNVMLLVLLIAIVPMGAFFKYQYESVMKLFIKHAQFSLATALERRDERIRSQYANIPAPIESNCPDKSHTHETNILTRRLNESWDVFDGFFYGTVREKHNGTETVNPPPPETDFLSMVSGIVPASNQAAIERRGLLASSAVMGVCSWPFVIGDRLVVTLNSNGDKQAWPWRRFTTSVPMLHVSVVPAFGVLVLASLLLLLIHFMIRKVFLLDVHKPTSHSLKRFLCDNIDRHTFVVVNAPFFRKKNFQATRLRLERFSDVAGLIRWRDEYDYDKCPDADIIAFDQFEYKMDDAGLNKKRLDLLNKLVKEENKKKLVLFSTVEPSEYKFGKEHANGFTEGDGEWAEVIIRNFITAYAEDTDDRFDDVKNEKSFKRLVDEHRARIMSGTLHPRKPEDVKDLIDTVYRECAPRVPLQDVGLHILQFEDFLELTTEHLLGRIASQARTYYNYLWRSCTDGEKQTLCHLAQDGRLSHRDPDIKALLQRGLIVRAEGLHLFNESFRRFLLSHEQRADVAEHDQNSQKESLWQMLKVPILATMIFVAGFLFWTQQDFFSSSLAVVTGVTGLLSAVFRLMSVFHGDGARVLK